MPALPPVPGVISSKVHFSLGADLNAIVRSYFEYTGTVPDDTTCQAFADNMMSAAVTHLIPELCSENAIVQTDCQDLSDPSGGFGINTTVTPGAIATAPLAAGTAFLINMHLARRYRGGKPRNYWPLGVAADLDSPTKWNATRSAAIFDAVVQYLEALPATITGTVFGTVCNVSYYQGFTNVTNPITGRTKAVAKLRTGGPVVDAEHGLSPVQFPASQRRRNRGGG